jgi:hypothetical protein
MAANNPEILSVVITSQRSEVRRDSAERLMCAANESIGSSQPSSREDNE